MGEVGKIAGPICTRWHGKHAGIETLNGPRSLIVAEKEKLIFLDRPAERAAELILLVGFTHGREEIARIECRIPQKFEDVTVNRVRPALRHYSDDTAGIIAIFRVEVVRQNAKFRDGIEIRNDTGAAVHFFLGIRSIDEETVGIFTLPADGLISWIQAAGRSDRYCRPGHDD